MARYINADKLIENLKKQYGEDLGWQCTINMSDVGMMIEDAPTADVVEVKHGEWEHTDEADHWHSKDECSECHYHTFDRIDLTHFNFCPNCGAKMDGGKRE